MAEATWYQGHETLDVTPTAAVTGGTVIQLPDGSAAVVPTDLNASQKGAAQKSGVYKVAKAAGIVVLDGGRVYWDYSANNAQYLKVNDRDFYVGRAVGDSASADTTLYVALNVNPPPDVDVLRDAALSVATGTAAAGGFGPPGVYGNARGLSLTATSEAQCVDILSVDRWATTAGAIVEGIFRIAANGSTSAVDFSLGIANGTSTTDADTITEHCLLHVDGTDLSLFFQSKDGTTTVNATDSTIDATAGSAVANRVEVWFDCRDKTNVKIYVNGARVLSGTTFALNGSGPLGLLAHVEKTTGTATAGPFYIDRLTARFQGF